jgi:hypothetical protein
VASRDSLTLKMKVTCFSEKLVDFQWTARHYAPEDKTLITTAVTRHVFATSVVSKSFCRNTSAPIKL